MTYTSKNEYLAAKDAYFAQMIAKIDCALAEIDSQTKRKAAPKDSGDPAGGSLSAPVGPEALTPGTLNANLHPCMLPFEDFVSDISHKQHPFCD